MQPSIAMNTDSEYQIIKGAYEIISKPESITPCETNWKMYRKEKTNQRKAQKDLKLRMFIINLNMRPSLPLPYELVMMIKHKALMADLKDWKPEPEQFNRHKWIYNQRDMDRTDYCNIDVFHGSTIGANPMIVRHRQQSIMYAMYKIKQHGVKKISINGTEYSKKAYLQHILELNNISFDKKRNVKQLIKQWIKL